MNIDHRILNVEVGAKQRKSKKELDNLFGTLIQRRFSGELLK